MDFLRRAVVATIACSWLFLSGCGNTYRPIASILPLATGNPQLADTVAVFNVNPNTNSVPDATGSLTIFNVNGDSNVGNDPIGANDKLATATPPVNPLTSRLITFAGSNSFIAAANTDNTLGTQSNTVTLINTLDGCNLDHYIAHGLHSQLYHGNCNHRSDPGEPAGDDHRSQWDLRGQVERSASSIPARLRCPSTICAGSKPGFILVAQSDTEAFILDQTDSNVSVLNLAALTPSSTASIVGTVGTNPDMGHGQPGWQHDLRIESGQQ